MSKISVLMTTYNSERFIESSLKSILTQSFKDFEIILIDDGSTDSTLKIVKNIFDPRIRLYTKQNTGLIDSLNFGIKKCSSELIARFDSDDICTFDRLESQYLNFSNRIAVMGSNALIIDSNQRIIGRTNFPNSNDSIVNQLKNFINPIIHPSVLINKNLLIKTGCYSYKYQHAEDFELWLRISKLGELKIMKEKLIYLRKHDNNISHSNIEVQLKNTLKALIESSFIDLFQKKIENNLEISNFLNNNKNLSNHINLTRNLINTSNKKALKKLFKKIIFLNNKRRLLKDVKTLLDEIN